MDYIERLRRGYQAFAENDLPTVLELLDPEIEWHDAKGLPFLEGEALIMGREAVRQRVLEQLPHQFNNLEIETRQFIAQGDDVVVIGYLTGNWMATARAFRANMVHVWTFREGRCIRFFNAVDTAEVIGAQLD
jgi:uncharacterized protein